MNQFPEHLQNLIDQFNLLPPDQKEAVLKHQAENYGKAYTPGDRHGKYEFFVRPDMIQISKRQMAEWHALHEAYLRLRGIIPGAFRTPEAPTQQQIFEVVERAAHTLCAQRDDYEREVVILRDQRMAPDRERELLAANNRYLERARLAERALRTDPTVTQAAWVATQVLLHIQAERRQGAFDEAGVSLDHQIKLLQGVAARDAAGKNPMANLGYAVAALVFKNLITPEFVADLMIQAADTFPRGSEPMTFQERVVQMMMHVAKDDPTCLIERGDRFGEEFFEFMQAANWSKERLQILMDDAYARPKGEIGQEVGGFMVTAAGFTHWLTLDMMACAERELERCNTPEVIAKIRNKRASRPKDGSPLSGTVKPFTGADAAALGITGEKLASFKPEHDESGWQPK